ncbi:MAG: N-acetyl-gamma-glutamyl-phosphate reductase [Phycisphaerales bacterium JB040]
MGAHESQHGRVVSVGVVGAPGYSGVELLRWLARHPGVRVDAAFASSRAGESLASQAPSLRGVYALTLLDSEPETILSAGLEAVFLCTPHEVSAALAPSLLEAGVVVLDLSAAFRLREAGAYPVHYGFTHPSSGLLGEAVYALPELYASEIASADLLACPGCYPTSAILPVAPLLSGGLLDVASPIIIDSTSGVSGAGRKATERTSFCEVSQRPYGVFSHRHTPEIAQGLPGAKAVFTPHLGPFERGIATTIHARLAGGRSIADVYGAWSEAYADAPFVRVRETGDYPGVGDVVHTNFIDVCAASDSDGHLIVCSAIDNLVKGASGQAVQAFNLRFGFPETAGLLPGGAGLGVLA